MDTIQDSPEETFGPKRPRFWRPKRRTGATTMVVQPRGKPFAREADWHTVMLVGAGIAAGAVLGAGVALLMAPQSGAHTRLALGREMRRRRPWRGDSPWSQLGAELRRAARHRNRRLGATDAA
jgi:hypothetical protein